MVLERTPIGDLSCTQMMTWQMAPKKLSDGPSGAEVAVVNILFITSSPHPRSMASSFLSSAASSSAGAGPSRLAAAPSPTPVSSSSAAQKPDRLYVGNLSPTVDE